jgi:alkylation response protein AidB-like acyl-CoA dehydrogenase
MSLIEGVALYQELGRALAPTPHFVSAVLSGGVLADRPAAKPRRTVAAAGASGEAIFTPAWLEPENGFSPRGSRPGPMPDGDGGFRLNGLKRHVAFASAADRLVVLARTGDDAEAIDLFLVDPTANGVTCASSSPSRRTRSTR